MIGVDPGASRGGPQVDVRDLSHASLCVLEKLVAKLDFVRAASEHKLVIVASVDRGSFAYQVHVGAVLFTILTPTR